MAVVSRRMHVAHAQLGVRGADGRSGGAPPHPAAPCSPTHAHQFSVSVPLPSQGALVMPLMAQGFQMGLVKFVAITARKPAA